MLLAKVLIVIMALIMALYIDTLSIEINDYRVNHDDYFDLMDEE